MKPMTRRELLIGMAGIPFALGFKGAEISTVVRMEGRPTVARLALGLGALLGLSGGRSVLSSMFNGFDVVGLKLNCLAGRRLSPRPELVMALSELIVEAGVKPGNVIVFDRSDNELKRAGYTLNRLGSGIRVYGINDAYEPKSSTSGTIDSCFTTILTRQLTKIVSIGVLKGHASAGVSLSMKNFFGVIHNPNDYHRYNCSPYIADVMNHPAVRDRLALSVIDAHTGQYHGGPRYNPRRVWEEDAFYLSLDPVAIDAVGWERIEVKRKERGFNPLHRDGMDPKYIRDAHYMNLGTADLARIKLITL